MLAIFDYYLLKARFAPACLSALPLLTLLIMIGDWSRFSLPEILISTIILILLIVTSDIARRRGRAVERKIFASTGGRPGNTELSRKDLTFQPPALDRYRAFLAARLERDAPTPESEAANPKGAADFYEECFAWLRENTRDKARFPLISEENATYGFRRNLLGMKPIGIFMNIITLIISYYIYTKTFIEINTPSNDLIIILIISFSHLLYFIFWVTKDSVKDASYVYARQLVASIDKIIEDKKLQ